MCLCFASVDPNGRQVCLSHCFPVNIMQCIIAHHAIIGVMSCHTLFLWRLSMEKFCDIQTRNELADFLRIPRSKLTYILYVKRPESYYSTFEIPKKSGGTREICAPSGDLKSIQLKLADALWAYQVCIWAGRKNCHNVSHAFEKGKSIITVSYTHLEASTSSGAGEAVGAARSV